MKKLMALILIFVGFAVFSPSVQAVVSVKGYYKSNGTYVAPHVRSNPNGLKYDNYGYKPSQGLYNPTYGTRGGYWDTPTYITDPDYYLGKSLYDQGKSSSSSSYFSYPTYTSPTTYTAPVLPTKNVSYSTKTWVDNNPSISCDQSTFLRAKEKMECITYKEQKYSYQWNVTTDDINGKHYFYSTDSNIINSCSDGYMRSVDKNGKVICAADLPSGCTSTLGFSPITGVSCSTSSSCGPGLTWNGTMCYK